jgi:hypothetical protein
VPCHLERELAHLLQIERAHVSRGAACPHDILVFERRLFTVLEHGGAAAARYVTSSTSSTSPCIGLKRRNGRWCCPIRRPSYNRGSKRFPREAEGERFEPREASDL